MIPRRCIVCEHLIWPWQHRGWVFGPEGPDYFHARCYPGRVLADALLAWFDRTHASDFGHDHHCPVPRDWENPFAETQIGDHCTCGWSDVLKAIDKRAAVP